MKNRTLFSYILSPLLILLVFISGGCSGQDEIKPEAMEFAREKEYDRGPVKFYVKLDKETVPLDRDVHLQLEVLADKEYEVAFPDVLAEGQTGSFAVKDFHVFPPKLTDNNIVMTVKTYRLEPFLSGEYKIPPFTFEYWKVEDSEKENVYTLETDELTVTVESILPEDMENITIEDIAGPVEPGSADLVLFFIIISIIIIAGGGGVFFIIWYNKRKAAIIAATYITPHEVAYRQLEAMAAMDYIGRKAYMTFYVVISDILRHYIENRFSLKAPESTTEEFLYNLQSTNVLKSGEKTELGKFLKHCDLVKFAEYEPTPPEIQSTFDICKNFIANTKSEDVKIPEPGPEVYIMPEFPHTEEEER